MIRKLAFWLMNLLKRWATPFDDELVLALTLYTNSLELPRGVAIELAPVKGMCGPFKLSGNSLPVFEYTVFEKSIMEFILIRVEISKPDRIDFRATIQSKDTLDSKRHGEEVECKERYQEPFCFLAWHLYQYFPYVGAVSSGKLAGLRILLCDDTVKHIGEPA